MDEVGQSEEFVEVSDERLLRVRGALSHRVGALMRAWWLGMVVVEDDEDERLYEEIVAAVGEPTERRIEGERTPLAVEPPPAADAAEPGDAAGLTRLSDEEYLAVFDQLMTRLELLRRAYERGMVVAESPEQERQLAELRDLLER